MIPRFTCNDKLDKARSNYILYQNYYHIFLNFINQYNIH